MYGNFIGTNIKPRISNIFLSHRITLCAGVQLLFKLSQPSLRYNKCFSFNISKFYSEHLMATDSKLCNNLRIVFFQVAPNCCFRNTFKKYFFWFYLCSFFILKSDSYFLKNCVICFTESPLKIMKNVFYFILKALFVLKIIKFLSWLFGHVGKMA